MESYKKVRYGQILNEMAQEITYSRKDAISGWSQAGW
jgi:hypothetical protein